jgi:hypothetical protein
MMKTERWCKSMVRRTSGKSCGGAENGGVVSLQWAFKTRRPNAALGFWTAAAIFSTYGGTEIPTASARPQSAGTFEISLKM